MKKQTKIKNTTATYRTIAGPETNLFELANTYKNYGDVPKTINDARAQEIALLARAFLGLRKVWLETNGKKRK